MIYSFAFLIFLYGAIKIEHSTNLIKKRWFNIEWLILVLLAGFRYKIGGDTLSYMQSFEYIPQLNNLERFDIFNQSYEPLWYLLNSCCKTICDSFFFFQFVHAIIVNTSVFYFFRRHSSRCFTSLFLYAVFFFFNYNTEILRVAISISIFLYSFDFLIEKKFFKYYICCLLAFGFHYQSVVLILFPLCHLTKYPSRKITIYFISLTLVAYISVSIIPQIANLLSFTNRMQETFDNYMSVESRTLNVFGLISFFIKVNTWILLLYLIRKEVTILRFFVFFAIFCTIMSFKYSVIFGRTLEFANPIIILLIVTKLRNRKFSNLVLIASVLFMWSSFYTWKVAGSRSYRQYYPYATWFYPEEDMLRNNVIHELHPNVLF